MEGSDRIGGDAIEDAEDELSSIFDEIHEKRIKREVAQEQELMDLFRIVGRRVSGGVEEGFESDADESGG